MPSVVSAVALDFGASVGLGLRLRAPVAVVVQIAAVGMLRAAVFGLPGLGSLRAGVGSSALDGGRSRPSRLRVAVAVAGGQEEGRCDECREEASVRHGSPPLWGDARGA